MRNKDIYRKEALEKLSAPERFDAAVEIVNYRGWWILITIAVLTTIILFWGFFGSISYKVNGQGMLITESGIFDVISVSSGQINKILIKDGDLIKQGDIIAYMDQPEIVDKIKLLKEQLKELSLEYPQFSKMGKEGYETRKIYLNQRYKDLLSAIKRNKKQDKFYQDKIKSLEKLLADGIITKNNLIETQHEYNKFLEESDKKNNELKEIEAKLIEFNKAQKEQLFDLQKKINDNKREIKQYNEQLKLNSTVVSKNNGRVIEIKVNPGDFINKGAPIITMESGEGGSTNLVIVAYVPVFDGKRVKPDMDMEIVPSSIKREEYGFLSGKVVSISTFPATMKSMMRVLRNQQLAEKLSLTGSPYEIRGNLIRNSKTFSGYKWSTREGPPIKIHSGTFCDFMITVKTQPPISFILPFFRKVLSI